MKNFIAAVIMSSLAPAAVVTATTMPASAGHYRLPVENFVTTEESQALAKAGVDTTLSLLDQIARVDKRKALAAKSGLTYARLSALASQTDLLRVDGLGPSMVLLLQAAGVRHTRDLAGADAASLREKMRVANEVQNLAQVLPQEDVVRSWIGHAARLPQVLEGVN